MRVILGKFSHEKFFPIFAFGWIMQFLSILPLSYPGISILNDDMGYVSKRTFDKNVEKIEFKVHSRLDKLEPRGCGDTLPDYYYI